MEFSQTKQHDVQERRLHRFTRHVIGERACARVRVRACVHACVGGQVVFIYLCIYTYIHTYIHIGGLSMGAKTVLSSYSLVWRQMTVLR